MKKTLQYDRVNKIFNEGSKHAVHALRDVSFAIDSGELFCLLGPSGCGKTTLLRCTAGLESITSGHILYGDSDITTIPPYRRNIGMVFQSFALYPHMNVFENVAYGLRVRKLDDKEVKRKVNQIMELVGLTDVLERNPSPTALSGGQQQRVAIARALVYDPDVLLLDEPLANLDAKLRRYMRAEIRRIQKATNITTIFVTHDQEEALAMSDWIFVMNEGEIVQSGTPVDIYDEPINYFVATFIGESNILPGRMIEDYLVEFNGKRFEAVDGGMRPNEEVKVVIRPEDLRITLPEEGKLQVKVDTQLFRGVHYEIIAYDDLGNEWMIHSTRKAIVGEVIGLSFEPEDIHIMRLNETEEEFDARIEEYVEVDEVEDGLINAIEEERNEENL